MGMSKQLLDAMNDQIAMEFAAAYKYLQMSAWFDEHNLPGFATWMRMQDQEEIEHAEKFFDFVLERGDAVSLRSVEIPPLEFDSPVDVFAAALASEEAVTAAIRNLYEIAEADKDYSSYPLLQWFLTEQVEEEQNVGLALETLKMVGDDKRALLVLDREMGQRGPEDGGE